MAVLVVRVLQVWSPVVDSSRACSESLFTAAYYNWAVRPGCSYKGVAMHLQEKKPLRERVKESAIKGIDKVQAALGQANERVTGFK